MGVESIKYHEICDSCTHIGYCDMAQFGRHNPRITACSHFVPSKQTNADRIRGMNDEELADEYIRIFYQLGCYTDSWAWLRKWLKAPVDEEEDND